MSARKVREPFLEKKRSFRKWSKPYAKNSTALFIAAGLEMLKQSPH